MGGKGKGGEEKGREGKGGREGGRGGARASLTQIPGSAPANKCFNKTHIGMQL